MKILLLVSGLPDSNNPARSVFNLKYARALINKGHDVIILYLRTFIPSRFPFKINNYKGIKVIEMGVLIPSTRFWSPALLIHKAFRFSLSKIAARVVGNVDYVHAVGGMIAPAAFLCHRKFKVPYIVQFIGSDVNVHLSKLLERAAFKNAVKHASFVTFNSIALKTEFERQYKSQTELKVIYRGIDLDKLDFHFETDASAIRILFLGGFVGVDQNLKGGKTLLDALSQVDTTIADFSVVISGPNSHQYKSHFENSKLAHNISFIGAVPHEDAIKLIQESHIVIIPSTMEGLPNVLFEAMACGNAIIASNIGGLPEVIVPKHTGLLFSANNTQELAYNIDLLLKTGLEGIEQFAKKGRERVGDFRYENFLENYINIYNENKTTGSV